MMKSSAQSFSVTVLSANTTRSSVDLILALISTSSTCIMIYEYDVIDHASFLRHTMSDALLFSSAVQASHTHYTVVTADILLSTLNESSASSSV